jgi:hypothetical protein
MEALEVLELPETSLTRDGLTQLSGMKGLKQLFIGGVDVAPGEVAALREALPGCLVSWWPRSNLEESMPGRRGGN